MRSEIFEISFNEGMNVELLSVKKENGVEIYEYKLSWTKENAESDSEFTFNHSAPLVGIMYGFNPKCGIFRCIDPDWCPPQSHMISNGAPMNCYYGGNSKNVCTVAYSEAKMLTKIRNGIVEENGNVEFKFTMGTKQFTNRFETTLSIYIDKRDILMCDAVKAVAKWWESLGITPAFVPKSAKEPVYSFWYSFHQDVNENNVEEECKRAKELGFDICIVDDGWQTSDGNRGYAYCGDWEPYEGKFPDMAKHVKRVHDMGMKYILWYSVPFVGRFTKAYGKFKDMFLRANHRANEFVLDPRYKEVRDYLLGVYKSALINWNLDGFKLDFIDSWEDRNENAPYNEKMDIPSLQDAVYIFMTTVMEELKKIKPDILLEFRQNYIGPYMRTFGNMFRVGDCPGNYIKNRVGVLDLRMLMGESAVHSDMLMWHKDESAENDALQIISVLYGVLQYSAKLDTLNERTAKMSKFWLQFMKDKKETLLEGTLKCYDPHLLYTWAESFRESENIIAVYGENRCITPEKRDTMYIANGSAENRVVLELEGEYKVEIMNCCGEILEEGRKKFLGISVLNIPSGGICKLYN
ncbi:MAG: alpha-galactosidase [Ruminococcaceae bacterium]|nr:alpha-galactosidase [Oscillospiraceae bacterium]